MIDEMPDLTPTRERSGPIRVWRCQVSRSWRWAIDTEDDGFGGHDTHGTAATRAGAHEAATRAHSQREAMRRAIRGW